MTSPSGDDRIETSADPTAINNLDSANDALPRTLLDHMSTAFGQQPHGFSAGKEIQEGWTTPEAEQRNKWIHVGTVAQGPDELSPFPWSNSEASTVARSALTSGLNMTTQSWQDDSAPPPMDDLAGVDPDDVGGLDPAAGASTADMFTADSPAADALIGDSATGGGSSVWSASLGGFFVPDDTDSPTIVDQEPPARAGFRGETFTQGTASGGVWVANPY